MRSLYMDHGFTEKRPGTAGTVMGQIAFLSGECSGLLALRGARCNAMFGLPVLNLNICLFGVMQAR